MSIFTHIIYMDINSKSIWEYEVKNTNYKILNSDITTDICIIGG